LSLSLARIVPPQRARPRQDAVVGRDCISDSDHISCHLMPKYAREMSRQLPSCLLDIGVADAAGTDFHQYLRWKKLRHWNLLQLPSVTLRWYHRRQHVRLNLVNHITDFSDGLAPHSSALELLAAHPGLKAERPEAGLLEAGPGRAGGLPLFQLQVAQQRALRVLSMQRPRGLSNDPGSG
jgi:hypothetical protein